MEIQHKNISSRASEAFLALSTLIWGATFVIMKTGLQDASPLMLLAMRFATAFAVFFIIFRKHFRAIKPRTVLRAVLLSLFFFSGYAMQTIGLKYTTVAKSSLFTYVFALFVPVHQYFFTGKKIKLTNLAGLIIVFTGMLLFTSPGSSSLNIGDWLTLIGAFGYSFFIVFVDVYSSKEDPIVLSGFQFLVTAVLALICSFFFEDSFVRPTFSLFMAVLYLAVPGSVIAITIVNKYQGGTTPVRACIIYSLEPVFSILLGWLVLKENLSAGEAAGAACILGGVVFAELSGLKSKK